MNTHACAWTVMVVTATDYDNILNYLRHGRYPAAFKKNDKRNLRRKSTVFAEKCGELYYTGGKTSTGIWRRVVLHLEERRKILDACHSSSEGSVL